MLQFSDMSPGMENLLVNPRTAVDNRVICAAPPCDGRQRRLQGTRTDPRETKECGMLRKG